MSNASSDLVRSEKGLVNELERFGGIVEAGKTIIDAVLAAKENHTYSLYARSITVNVASSIGLARSTARISAPSTAPVGMISIDIGEPTRVSPCVNVRIIGRMGTSWQRRCNGRLRSKTHGEPRIRLSVPKGNFRRV
jgi:hypothetical protein